MHQKLRLKNHPLGILSGWKWLRLNSFISFGLLAIFHAIGRLAAGLLVVALILAIMTKPLKETKETNSFSKTDTLVS